MLELPMQEFPFQSVTNKICTIIVCGNALLYGYSYKSSIYNNNSHTIVGMSYRPQTPRGTNLVSIHT
jgi:hypothetical protein